MIRAATHDDLPSIHALERACPTAAHWNQEEYMLVFDPGATPRILLVAEEATVVGFIVVRALAPEWEIENVAVASECRGLGIGSQLVLAILRQARSRGVESVFLEVRASNAAARGLYTRCGFTEIGRRRGYYSNPEEDAVLCRLHLGDVSFAP